MAFDSVRVVFPHGPLFDSVFENTIDIKFNKNYFETIKLVVERIESEYFWLFAGFTNLKEFSHLGFVPTNKNIQVFYTTHPKGGFNKEGNVFLIHTKEFKQQSPWITKLKQYNQINYHPDPVLYQRPIAKTYFKMDSPFEVGHDDHYRWYINKDLQGKITVPDLYPSYWEDEFIYTWGKTKDIMLVPNQKAGKVEKNTKYEYKIEPFEMVEMQKISPLAYVTKAVISQTKYFWTYPEGTDLTNIDLDFQPDRIATPRHHRFGDVVLVNRDLILKQKGKLDV